MMQMFLQDLLSLYIIVHREKTGQLIAHTTVYSDPKDFFEIQAFYQIDDVNLMKKGSNS